MLLIVGVLFVLLAIWVLILGAKGDWEGLSGYLAAALFISAFWGFSGASRARGRYCEAYKSQVIPAPVS